MFNLKWRYSRWLSVPLLFIVLHNPFLALLPVQTATHVSPEKSEYGFSPDEIVSRAREWVAANFPYSQDTTDPTGSDRFHNYRADCSGLVSMSWGIPATPPNYGLNTTSLASVADLLGKALDDSGKPIMSTLNKLQKGDILLNQGVDAHVILFVGWIDVAAKQVVNHPILNNDGYYYYDGIEENGSAGKNGQGQAIEHTPSHPLNSHPFDYSQPWQYPYYPGYNSEGYYAWQFDATKAAQLGITPAPSIQPGGQWVTPPSPKNGDTVTNIIHFAASAYPSQRGAPPIADVYFTMNVNGSWGLACLPVAHGMRNEMA